MTKRSLVIITIICIFSASLSHAVQAQSYNDSERGIAVFYADYLEGRTTAYGDVYRSNELTAAHRSHPAGTLLKVTRLDNQRSVVVRVNDRGPFCDGCVVDLSKAAAIQLDLIRSGRAEVLVEVIGSQGAPVAANSNIQRNNIAFYEQPNYSAPANRNSSYPRPDAISQSLYSRSVPSDYSDTPPVRINTSPAESTPPPAPDPARSRELQRRGLNAYNQIEAFDSYNYYQAQAAERRAVQEYAANAEQQTYERLQARGLQPQASQAITGGGGQPRPSSYESGSTASGQALRSVVAPAPYSDWNSSRSVAAQPESYSAARSVPQEYASVSNISPKGSYAVQFASYRNFDNAQRQLQRLKQMGLGTAYMLETNYRGDKLYKVLNGPFQDQATAAAELKRYQSRLSLDGIVIFLD